MTNISVESANIAESMGVIIDRTDTIDEVLTSMPPAADGGVASSLIAFIATAGAEAMGLVADTYRALDAITLDVIRNMSLTDAQFEASLKDLQKEVNGQ